MTELPKTFDPAAIETRWYQHWEANGLFRPDRPGAEPFTIVNPPPNVTGSLHVGHALDNTLQDILARHARLKGKDALWVVGTDHAAEAVDVTFLVDVGPRAGIGGDAQGVAPIPLSPQGIPNSHLSYAVQWFLLAVVWAGMTAGLIWRITRRPV